MDRVFSTEREATECAATGTPGIRRWVWYSHWTDDFRVYGSEPALRGRDRLIGVWLDGRSLPIAAEGR